MAEQPGYSAFGTESGFLSVSSAPPPVDDSWSLLPVIACLLLLGGAGIFFAVAAGAVGAPVDDENANVGADIGGEGGGGGGGGGGSVGGGGGGSPPLPLPIVVASPKPTPVTVAPVTTAPEPPTDVRPPSVTSPTPGPRPTPPPATTTTTAVPVQPRKELICTVGSLAVELKMYPRDGLCHYLFYTHVFVYTNKTIVNVQSTTITASFRVFQEVMARSRKTEGGLSFDAASTNKTYAKRVRRDLMNLAKKEDHSLRLAERLPVGQQN